MVLYVGNETREEILKAISDNPIYLDNLLAMANTGMAFSSIYLLEELVAALIGNSKARLSESLDGSHPSTAELFLERHAKTRSSTLGRLVSALEASGFGGKDLRYFRAIVSVRNDFIHRFGFMVPLPGDWPRFNYQLEDFSAYTRYVIRHMYFAQHRFPRSMVKFGLLEGEFGDFGGLLHHPDSLLNE